MAVKSLVEVGDALISPGVGVIEVLGGALGGLEPGELALSSVELIAAMLKTFLRLNRHLSGPVVARPSAGPGASPSAGVAEFLMPRADALLGLVPGEGRRPSRARQLGGDIGWPVGQGGAVRIAFSLQPFG